MFDSIQKMFGAIALAMLAFGLQPPFVDCRADDKPETPKSNIGERATPQPSDPSSLAGWLNQLGSRNYQQRRAAFLHVWNRGATALPLVRDQLSASNKQVAEACSILELLLRLEVTPNDNSELIDLIQLAQGESDTALYELCDKGHWKLASEILAANPTMTKTLQSPYVYHQLNQLVDKAVEQKNASLAWPIVAQLLPADEALWLLEKQHPGSALDDSLAPDVRAKRLLYRGRNDEAFELAKDPFVRLRIALSSGNSSALAEPVLVAALLRNQNRSPANRAARAALHLIAGQPEQSQAELDSLYAEIGFGATKPRDASGNAQETSPALSSINPNHPDYARFINALLIAGQGAQVQSILLEQNAEGAFAYCLARSDHAAALKSAGLESDLANFDAWLQESIASLKNDLRIDIAQRLDVLVRVASVLLSVGFESQGDVLLEKIIVAARDGSRVERNGRSPQADCWDRISFSLQTAQLRGKLLKLVTREFDGLSRECRHEILGNLYSEWPQVAAALLSTAPVGESAAGQLSKWNLLENLWRLDRDAFEPESHEVLEKWFRKALAALAAEEELNSQHSDEFIRLTKQLRLPELAMEFASGELTGSYNWAETATMLLQRGHAESAAEYWEAARQRDHTQLDWLFHEISARALSGDLDRAQILERSLAYRPLPPSGLGRGENSYRSVAATFLEHEILPQAYEFARTATCLTPVPSAENSWSCSLLADVLETQKLHLASADARRAASLPALAPNLPADRYWAYLFGRPSTVLGMVQKEHVQRAVGLIAQGQFDAAEKSMRMAEELQPHGIEVVEECYPGLVAAGKLPLADELLARFSKRMLEHLDRWPKDATAHNNFAWMLARCHVRLSESLEHARIATQLAPDSPTLLDTLAEAYYRNGQIDAAIAAAEKCLRLDPREAHYRQQISRFRKRQ